MTEYVNVGGQYIASDSPAARVAAGIGYGASPNVPSGSQQGTTIGERWAAQFKNENPISTGSRWAVQYEKPKQETETLNVNQATLNTLKVNAEKIQETEAAQKEYTKQYAKATTRDPSDPFGYYKDVAYQVGRPALNVETLELTGYANMTGYKPGESPKERVIGSIIGARMTPEQVMRITPGGYVRNPVTGGSEYRGGSEYPFPETREKGPSQETLDIMGEAINISQNMGLNVLKSGNWTGNPIFSFSKETQEAMNKSIGISQDISLNLLKYGTWTRPSAEQEFDMLHPEAGKLQAPSQEPLLGVGMTQTVSAEIDKFFSPSIAYTSKMGLPSIIPEKAKELFKFTMVGMVTLPIDIITGLPKTGSRAIERTLAVTPPISFLPGMEKVRFEGLEETKVGFTEMGSAALEDPLTFAVQMIGFSFGSSILMAGLASNKIPKPTFTSIKYEKVFPEQAEYRYTGAGVEWLGKAQPVIGLNNLRPVLGTPKLNVEGVMKIPTPFSPIENAILRPALTEYSKMLKALPEGEVFARARLFSGERVEMLGYIKGTGGIGDMELRFKTGMESYTYLYSQKYPTQTQASLKEAILASDRFMGNVKASKKIVSILREEGTTVKIGGSVAQYTWLGKEMWRPTGDIDLYYSKDPALLAKRFVKELNTIYGEGTLRIAEGKSSLVEIDVGGGKFIHAFDIHRMQGEPVVSGAESRLLNPTYVGYGYKVDLPVITSEGFREMGLREQAGRKLTSTLMTREFGFSPEAHRLKDVGDYLNILHSKGGAELAGRFESTIPLDIMKSFGKPETKVFVPYKESSYGGGIKKVAPVLSMSRAGISSPSDSVSTALSRLASTVSARASPRSTSTLISLSDNISRSLVSSHLPRSSGISFRVSRSLSSEVSRSLSLASNVSSSLASSSRASSVPRSLLSSLSASPSRSISSLSSSASSSLYSSLSSEYPSISPPMSPSLSFSSFSSIFGFGQGPPIRMGMPMGNFFTKKLFKEKIFAGKEYRYTPSVAAVMEGISSSKMPRSTISGLNLRPVIRGRRS
jgi:hypothetical protein